MRSYHNIESLKPLSKAKVFPYVGYAASGSKYYATRRHDGKMWRFALPISSTTGEPPYFYVKTLAEASAKLETIGTRFSAWQNTGRYVASLKAEGQELGRPDDSDSAGMVYSVGFIEEWIDSGARQWLCNVGNDSRVFVELPLAEAFLWEAFADAESRS